MTRQLSILLLLSALFRIEAAAQPTRQLTTGFEREVNRFRWTSVAVFEVRAAGWDVALTNRFLSDAFVLFEDRLNFRDEDVLSWRASRVLAPQWSAHLRGRAAWFGQSRVFSQEAYGGIRLAVRPYAWIEPALGLAWDQRPGAVVAGGPAPLRFDAGPAFGLRLHATPPAEDARLRLDGEATWQALTPRQGHTLRLDGAAERLFETTRLGARLRVARFRRDVYQAVSFLNRSSSEGAPESIEATTSDTLDLQIEFDAPVYRGVRFVGQLDGVATNRFIRTERAPSEALFFETDFNRRALDAELGLAYETGATSAHLALVAGAATERRRLANREALPTVEAAQKTFLLQQADYDEGLFALRANVRVPLGRRLVVRFDGASRIVRHDTPEVNPDDRDEVYHNAAVSLQLRLSRYLSADVQLFGSFYHTVYLNAARSAENNIQRALRLRPSFRWTPSPATRLRLSTELRATYTVDDFLLQGRRPTDQSAREMRLEAEAEHQAAPDLRLMATGSFGDLHLGRLLWDDFAEIPFDTLRTYSGWIHAQLGQRFLVDLGVRFFIRSDFDRATTVRYERLGDDGQPISATISRPGRTWIEQIGPTAAITWPMGRGSAIRLDGWMNIQHIRRRLYGALPEAVAPAIRQATRRGSRQLIPNLALTAVWNF